MNPERLNRVRPTLIWTAFIIAIAIPMIAAARSPLLAWREPVYILAGFAGVVGMVLLLAQPLLVGGKLEGLSGPRGRNLHRFVGGALVFMVAVHVGGLWLTSPPDVIDALLFVSPTPFSVWGVLAMWAVFAVAVLAALRRRLRIHLRIWRLAHISLALVIVVGSVVHALLIQGTMETISKVVLCALTLLATLTVIAEIRGWKRR